MLKFIVSFICFVVLCVMLFAASGPLISALVVQPQRKLAQQLHIYRANVPPFPPSPPPPPPVQLLPPPPPLSVLALARSVDAKGAMDPGGAARISESSPLIQGMIEAGFSRAQAVKALEAVGAKSKDDIPKAIKWQLEQGTDRNLAEFRAEREVQSWDMMDFDGYALIWGDKHRVRTLEECGKKCIEWVPKPPANFACNAFVFCPLPKCFAPAALPPGSMTGQCWLKHQEDPNNPQVNMRGNYSRAYLQRHPGAPPSVQWQAGVVVRKGSAVDLSTWSSRANW